MYAHPALLNKMGDTKILFKKYSCTPLILDAQVLHVVFHVFQLTGNGLVAVPDRRVPDIMQKYITMVDTTVNIAMTILSSFLHHAVATRMDTRK